MYSPQGESYDTEPKKLSIFGFMSHNFRTLHKDIYSKQIKLRKKKINWLKMCSFEFFSFVKNDMKEVLL